MWDSCLYDGKMEPRIHSYHPDVGRLNASCLRQRMLHLHGTAAFLPVVNATPSPHLFFGRAQEAMDGLLTRVREVNGCLPPGRFLREHGYEHLPVVMRGCVHGTTRLSDDFLARTAGDWYGGSVFKAHGLPLKAYLKQYQRPGSVYAVRTCLPEALLAELTLPEPLRCQAILDSIARNTIENVVLWLSNGNQVSRLHHDGGDFLLVQLDGQKRVTLVNPTDSHRIYSDFGVDQDGAPLYGTSPIEPRALDDATYPEAAAVPVQRTTLSPGDVLYIPHLWWHVVESLAGRNLAYTVQTELPEPDECLQLDSRVRHSVASPALAARHRCWRGGVVPERLASCLDVDAATCADDWGLASVHIASNQFECENAW